jgi:hypothetical protein
MIDDNDTLGTEEIERSIQTMNIQTLIVEHADFYLLGDPNLGMIMNRLTAKAQQQLLLPPLWKNRAERAQVLKHEPVEEFRQSVYRCRDRQAPTAIHMPEGMIKRVLVGALGVTPGATRSEIARFVRVISETIYVYGIPYLYMRPVRQANAQRTPDIRTRAYFPEWACHVRLQYIKDLVRGQQLGSLLANGGIVCGCGDGRTERGVFDYGQFTLVHHDDERWRKIVKNQGRAAQLAALEHPVPADEETEQLLKWYDAELIHREKVKKTAPKTAAKVGRKPKAPAPYIVAKKTNGRSKGAGR